ncbi:MAG: signal peptidase II [Pirellulales bacterium]
MKAVPADRYALFFTVVVVGLAVDLLTKHWVFHWLGMPPTSHVYWVWSEYIGFQTSLNEGALFGLGQGKVFFFALFSIAVAIAIPVWLFYAGAGSDLLLCFTLALITAGIFGNLYDRLGLHDLQWPAGARQGQPVFAVRDFILFQLSHHLRWPNFNVADSMLVCGSGLLLWRGIRTPASGGSADEIS